MLQIAEEIYARVATESNLSIINSQPKKFLLNHRRAKLVAHNGGDPIRSENVCNLLTNILIPQGRLSCARPAGHVINHDSPGTRAMQDCQSEIVSLEGWVHGSRVDGARNTRQRPSTLHDASVQGLSCNPTGNIV